MANILLGVTGSSSIKLIIKLFNELSKENSVKIILSDNSKQLLSDVKDWSQFAIQNIDKIYTTDREYIDYNTLTNKPIYHIELAHWADKFLIAPCTANTLNKIRYGICDNLLTSCWMAFKHTKENSFIAPAMNTQMLENSFDTIQDLRNKYTILYPTVKKLSCGDYGLGALADIYDITNIVNGYKWHTTGFTYHPGIFSGYRFNDWHKLSIDHPGAFGTKRKYDIHSGIDLYQAPNHKLYESVLGKISAVEDGEIISIGPFTGKEAGCDWWLDSKYVTILGKSGRVVYGEIEPLQDLKVGNKVNAGQEIGNIVQILKHPPSKFVYGHQMKMLHLELLTHNAPEMFISRWQLDQERPKYLKDPTIYLFR